MKFKRSLCLIIAIIMILCFAACGKTQEPATATSTPDSPQKTEAPQEEPQPLTIDNPTLKLSLDEWPVVDGATAFLPYYQGMAELVLGMSNEEAGQYILCSTTDYAYPNLVDGKADLIFCLLPSEDQVSYAKENNVEFETVPILNEGFVFFVNKDNPVDSVTIQQLHDIYSGKITNWKELGGNDEEIIAYQRSEGSGSQTGLYLHVIDQDEVVEPPTDRRIGTMGEIVDAVAGYDNAKGAIGYSYLYFVTNQHFDEDIKLLKIEGVTPDTDTISGGSYPMISEVCAVFRNSEAESSVVRQIAAWCAGEQGQTLALIKGYVPCNK